MNWFVQRGLNPWNEEILTHAQWNLAYVALAFGVVFMVAHTLYVAFWPKPAGGDTAAINPEFAARVPAKVKRHSLRLPRVGLTKPAAMRPATMRRDRPSIAWTRRSVKVQASSTAVT